MACLFCVYESHRPQICLISDKMSSLLPCSQLISHDRPWRNPGKGTIKISAFWHLIIQQSPLGHFSFVKNLGKRNRKNRWERKGQEVERKSRRIPQSSLWKNTINSTKMNHSSIFLCPLPPSIHLSWVLSDSQNAGYWMDS